MTIPPPPRPMDHPLIATELRRRSGWALLLVLPPAALFAYLGAWAVMDGKLLGVFGFALAVLFAGMPVLLLVRDKALRDVWRDGEATTAELVAVNGNDLLLDLAGERVEIWCEDVTGLEPGWRFDAIVKYRSMLLRFHLRDDNDTQRDSLRLYRLARVPKLPPARVV